MKAKSPRSEVQVSAGIIFLENEAPLDPPKTFGKGPFLMASRPPGKFMAGYWEFPGGKIEAGESPEEALCRELFEEINLRVYPKNLAFVLKRSHEYEAFLVTIHVFYVLKCEGPLLSKEGQEIRFLTKGEALEKPLLPSNRDIIAMVC